MRQGTIQRATIGGYFQLRLPSPYSVPLFNPRDYLTKPHEYNQYIQDNIDLLCEMLCWNYNQMLFPH